MRKAIFVTGTDTDAGKTFISAILVQKSIQSGNKTAYIKPVETGLGKSLIPLDYSFVKKFNPEMSISSGDSTIERYEFPYCPYESSLMENRPIDIQILADKTNRTISQYDFSVVEGAGGVMVPITENFCVIDFIKMLQLDAVVVGKCGLGTINHTCLTIQSLQKQNVHVACYILNGKDAEAAPQNIQNITRMTGIKCGGIIPYMDKINPEIISNVKLDFSLIF
jgi:dethiobiotin synthetase